MGLVQALDYRTALPNPPQRGVQLIAETKAGSWVLQRTMYRLDRPLFRLTDGRLTLPGLLTGLPVVLLTTTGAKSGLPRSMPIAGIPLEGNIALMGTNLAQPRTPAWVLNLEADPTAQVSYRGRTVAVVARPATSDERERAWTAAAAHYKGFATYRTRIIERPVRIFILEVAGG